MDEGPLDAARRRALLEQHLAPPFPEAAAADLLPLLAPVDLAEGDWLLRQGEASEDVFLLTAGRLRVEVRGADGGRIEAGEILPGEVVGEMALLTGQPRTASVVAVEPSQLARLSRMDFEQVAPRHPDALALFLHRLLPRLKRTQIVRVLAELFGEMDALAVEEFLARLQWCQLVGGDTLFREGETSDDVFIVVNGRLRSSVRDSLVHGGERVIEEVGRGSAVGELALLTGEARAATTTAVRDSDLLRLAKADFDALLDRHPRAMLQVARASAQRLRTGVAGKQAIVEPATFVLVGASPNVPLAEVAGALVAQLASAGTVACHGSASIDQQLGRPGIAQVRIDDAIHESIVSWLAAVEREHRYLVLVADADFTPWTQRCLRQADRVLIVGNADADPAPGRLEHALAGMKLPARCELVLLQDANASRPQRTLAWLAPRAVAAHHHLRLGHARDEARMARRVSGRAVALVLGGGGARGFAHIGVLRALAERGIDIDMVGGTSIGSVIGAACAFGLSTDEQTGLARSFASRSRLMDRTLPIVAMMKGEKLVRLYRMVFGDTAIEDLWTPFFAVSSGLSRAEAVVHDTGPLWRAVRGSTAVPAIFPPLVAEDGEVLVDGNVMNNMPIDIMRGRVEAGTLIGVNPMPIEPRMRAYRFGPSVSGWGALLGRWGIGTVRAPSLFGAVMRATEINSANRMRQGAFRALADLLIEPPLGEFPILDYARYAPIIETGYRAGCEALEGWAATRGPLQRSTV